MYKKTISASEIIRKQNPDGSWGLFHTLSEPSKNPLTTEQALRRLEVLGFTIEDDCIFKAVQYMKECLREERDLPDPKEKSHDEKIFREMMLSTWIRKFTKEDVFANSIAKQWAETITFAFRSGKYIHGDYLRAYEKTFHKKAKGDRLTDFVNYYQVSLISDMLPEAIEDLIFDYILNHKSGIYYIGYRKKLSELPEEFTSKQALKYVASIELLSQYKCSQSKLNFAVEWIKDHCMNNNQWDFTSKAKDHIHLPLSDSWKEKENRFKDSTYMVQRVLEKISLSHNGQHNN